jgi:hypothetical protein
MGQLPNVIPLDQPYSLEALRETCGRLLATTWFRKRRQGA